MTLTKTAYLEIDDGSGTTATFEFALNFEVTTEGEKLFIMSDRGQYLREIADHEVVEAAIGADDSPISRRRTGYVIDGGAGSEQLTLTIASGEDDRVWGDGTGGGSNTTTDASGADVNAIVRKQVLEYWLRRTRTDSLGPQARLHWGEWTDGNISQVSGVSAGLYGEPMPVAIQSWSFQSPRIDQEVTTFEGTIQIRRIAIFPGIGIPDWVANAADKISDQIEGVNDR